MRRPTNAPSLSESDDRACDVTDGVPVEQAHHLPGAESLRGIAPQQTHADRVEIVGNAGRDSDGNGGSESSRRTERDQSDRRTVYAPVRAS